MTGDECRRQLRRILLQVDACQVSVDRLSRMLLCLRESVVMSVGSKATERIWADALRRLAEGEKETTS